MWNLEKLGDFDLPINLRLTLTISTDGKATGLVSFFDPKVMQQTHFVAFCTIPNLRTGNKNYLDSPETNFQSDFHDFGVVQK